MRQRRPLLDGRIAPPRPLGPLWARLDPCQSWVGRRRLGGEVGAGEDHPLGIDGEQTPGHADHGRRLTAEHLDERRGRVAQFHLHHLPHPGVHVEGTGEAVGQFRVVKRQAMVEARIAQRFGADVGLHPRRLSTEFDRFGDEHHVVAPPHPLGHPRPDEGGQPHGREDDADRAEPHAPRGDRLPNRGLLRKRLRGRDAAAGVGCHWIACRPLTKVRSGG